ncbi:MAG: glycosyltransferase family 39 protein [Candidatus Roizmanbacteria bacterium]
MKSSRDRRYLIYFVSVSAMIGLLIYTRFVNLSWSLPYPMHPDERNMVDSIIRLGCSDWTQIPSQLYQSVGYMLGIRGFSPVPHATSSAQACLHPFFFAYGQLSLYLGWVIAHAIRIISSNDAFVTFGQAALALRIISAVASCISTLYMYRIVVKLLHRALKPFESVCAYLIIILTPVMIQFAHFGTTESLLTMWYVISIYESLALLETRSISLKHIVWLGVVSGCAIGTKLSGILTVGPPIFALMIWLMQRPKGRLGDYRDVIRTILKDKTKLFVACLVFGFTTIFWLVVTSPYNIIAWPDFMSTITYEGGVGMGTSVPFYTRQFYLETPGIFQLLRILPYSHGLIMSIAAVIGFTTLSWKSPKNNLFRFAMMVVICANVFLFAKWTRFLAPLYPLMTIASIVGSINAINLAARFIKRKKRPAAYFIGLGVVTVLACIFGFATVSIYTNIDSRIAASAWMYTHVKPGAYILSETANVIDIPISNDQIDSLRPANYGIQNVSFNFYDLDTDLSLQSSLVDHINRADYIIVPSRRIFYNHTCRPPLVSSKPGVLGAPPLASEDPRPMHSAEKCAFLRAKYPVLNAYYDGLFSGTLGYKQVAKITSYPRITLLGHTLIEFPDENAEETSTVFDHPVIRIYQNVKKAAN